MTTEFQREQQERRETLQNDRKVREQGTTFSTFAEAFADEDRGGRYAAVNKTNVIGTQAAPQYPEGPAWCAGDQGVEPSLGYAINDAPIVGEAYEVEKSLRELGETVLPSGPPDGGAVEDDPASGFLVTDAVETAAPPTPTTDNSGDNSDDEPPRAA